MNETPKTPESLKKECNTPKCGSAESISRIIIALVCLVAALYFFQIPNILSANVGDFQRGILTATFIFAGLIAAHPVLVRASKKE